MSTFNRNVIGCLTICLVASVAYAQNETNNWILGFHGVLNFGPPPVSGTPQINTVEGCSSISNSAGQLQMYTDGVTIWNGSHTQIATGLLGTHGTPPAYATQAAIIIPRPNSNCKEYFVFYLQPGFEGTAHPQLSYSIVNFSGGAGSVTLLNAPLWQDVAEKLAATSDGSGGYYLVAHGHSTVRPAANSEFYAFHIDVAGTLHTTPTISTGSPHVSGTFYTSSFDWSGVGQMKISSFGNRIACAVASKLVEVRYFDRTTGAVITDSLHPPIVFNADLGGPHLPFESSLAYGLEFDSTGHFVYVSTLSDPNRNLRGQLYQFDLTTQTGVVVDPGSLAHDIGQLQLAPNGNVYIARSGHPFLGVFTSASTACPGCGYAPNGQPLTTGTSALGLPAFIAGPFSCASGCPANTTPTTINGVTFCCGTPMDNGQICCNRLCPAGTSPMNINGETLCCSTNNSESTSSVCCTKP